MPVYKAGKVTVTYNGIDLTPYIVQEGLQTITIDLSHPNCKSAPLARIRPAAPIRACLWRRNLDGGAWRKRGHVAHRG